MFYVHVISWAGQTSSTNLESQNRAKSPGESSQGSEKMRAHEIMARARPCESNERARVEVAGCRVRGFGELNIAASDPISGRLHRGAELETMRSSACTGKLYLKLNSCLHLPLELPDKWMRNACILRLVCFHSDYKNARRCSGMSRKFSRTHGTCRAAPGWAIPAALI